MIRLQGTITHADDSVENVEVNQRDYAAWEIYAVRNGFNPLPADAPPMLWTRYLGYAAHYRLAGEPRASWPAFEDWDAVDVELESPAEVEAVAVNPSPRVRSAG